MKQIKTLMIVLAISMVLCSILNFTGLTNVPWTIVLLPLIIPIFLVILLLILLTIGWLYLTIRYRTKKNVKKV